MTTTRLENIEHFVVIMLENRSFDHIFGFLYENDSPSNNKPFDGLTGKEFNLDQDGGKVFVSKLETTDPYCYFTPKADPGEGFIATSAQLYQHNMLVHADSAPTNGGFVTDYQYTLGWEPSDNYIIYPGADAQGIMAMHTPETLPILSTLAKEYAVCDRWFCSAPTETQPNRAFMHMATSQGLIKNNWHHEFTSKSIFTALQEQNASWSIYAYEDTQKQLQMTRFDIADLKNAPKTHFGAFSDFKTAAKSGTLANYVFLEPNWGTEGNSMHPNYNAANAEQYIKEIYETLVKSPLWEKTMLIVTFDEHGGCYDHVAPPANAVSPDDIAASNGFDFTRFGVRVPTILISPYIKAGTVHRVPEPDEYQPGKGESPKLEPTPFDHTSILKTVEMRFGVQPLTKRDAAAPHFADVLTLDKPRMENVLANVKAPTAKLPTGTVTSKPTELQKGIANRVSQYPDPQEKGGHKPFERYHWHSGDDMMEWANDRWQRYTDYTSKLNK
ncbi:MAG: phosphoesterase [Alteromonadaceae bacterium]|nr:phosphoesterase [Alteromonadaceae bacterium]